MEDINIRLHCERLNETFDLTPLFKSKKEIIIGRQKDCDLVIPYNKEIDLEFHQISRRHCSLIFYGLEKIASQETEPYSFLYIKDLESKNGTYLNNRRLERGKEYPLFNNDEIGLASLTLKLKICPKSDYQKTD